MLNPVDQQLYQDHLLIRHDQATAELQIANRLINLLPTERTQPIAIICIGTDRSTGDSLGPLIGSFLEKMPLKQFNIYGTLDHPVHAVNLQEKVDFIYSAYYDPFIIAIDACLGRLQSVGHIKVDTGAIKPGAGVNKDLPAIGDMHITGIVNVAGYMEFFVLQNTRLNLVMNMAKTVSRAIIKADQVLTNQDQYMNLQAKHAVKKLS